MAVARKLKQNCKKTDYCSSCKYTSLCEVFMDIIGKAPKNFDSYDIKTVDSFYNRLKVQIQILDEGK